MSFEAEEGSSARGGSVALILTCATKRRMRRNEDVQVGSEFSLSIDKEIKFVLIRRGMVDGWMA